MDVTQEPAGFHDSARSDAPYAAAHSHVFPSTHGKSPVRARPVRWARIAVAVLVVIAISAGILGIWDTATARGLAPRLFGVFILSVSALAAAGAYGLHESRVWAPWPVGLCGVVLVGMGTTALLVNAQEHIYYGFGSLRTVAFGVLATVIGLFLLSIIFRPWRALLPPAFLRGSGDPPKSALENLRDTIGTLGALGIAAASVAFWYSNIYVPANQLPALNTQLELATTSVEGQTQLHTKVTLANASAYRVRTFASSFNIFLEDQGDPYDPARQTCVLDATYGDTPVVEWPTWPAVQARDGVVVSAGDLLPNSYWLEPGEEFVTGFVTPLPTGRSGTSIVRAQVEISLARSDVMSTSSTWIPPDSTYFGEPGSAFPCASTHGWTHGGSVVWELVPESLFNRLTKDAGQIQTDWLVMDDGSIESSNWVVKDEQGQTDNQLDRALQLYGISRAFASEEIVVSAP